MCTDVAHTRERAPRQDPNRVVVVPEAVQVRPRDEEASDHMGAAPAPPAAAARTALRSRTGF